MHRQYVTIFQVVALLCSITVLTVAATIHNDVGSSSSRDFALRCIKADSACAKNSGMQLADFVQKPKLQQKKQSVRHTARTICAPNPTLTLAYEQRVSRDLSNTNTHVDAVRAQALNNGESYQDFDAQLNSLFAAYNSEVQNDYAAYAANFHDCNMPQQPPQLFDMFTP